MTTYEPTEIEGTDLKPRTERALTECMTVLPDALDLFTVVGENGNESYTVDARAGVQSFQLTELFGDLLARENLWLALQARTGTSVTDPTLLRSP